MAPGSVLDSVVYLKTNYATFFRSFSIDSVRGNAVKFTFRLAVSNNISNNISNDISNNISNDISNEGSDCRIRALTVELSESNFRVLADDEETEEECLVGRTFESMEQILVEVDHTLFQKIFALTVSKKLAQLLEECPERGVDWQEDE
eukprot:Platyproteum_vivax@DN9109_c0_g1_i1.p1